MKQQLREATVHDVDAVLALLAHPDMDGHAQAPEQARAMFEQLRRNPDWRLFVACEQDGAVVGSYTLQILRKLGHGGSPAAIAEDVVVRADRRGQGVGRLLMAHAHEQARAAGCYKLALSSNRRRAEAHAFYESIGFALHGYSFVIQT